MKEITENYYLFKIKRLIDNNYFLSLTVTEDNI